MQTSEHEINRNWNAGDTETAEPAVEPDSEGAVEEAGRGVSDADQMLSTAEGGEKNDEVEAADGAANVSDETLLLEEDKIVKLRRLSALDKDNGMPIIPASKTEQKRKSSTVRASRPTCIRRCVAEDDTWHLKTVPDLDMLIVKYFADNYAGRLYLYTFNTFDPSGIYTSS